MIVEEVRETRAKLLKKYGGSDGYAEHLLADRLVTREPRSPVKTRRRTS
jgi:hypothetical protein